jgi:hypothetical protein
MRTTDKVILSILAIFLVGMGGVFIAAVSNQEESSISSNRQLLVTDTTPEPTIFVLTNNIEDDESEDEETEVAITGSALEKASVAALAYIGQGRVTDSEIGDEDGLYEVEITLNNGNEVDVHLDENFRILSTEYEDEQDDD